MPLRLDIECRRCGKKFKRFLRDTPTDITIKCPFCLSFALTLIGDFSLGTKEYAYTPAAKIPDRRKRKKL
ncbi:MAG: hypothetical protein BMS9Abin23_0555 [Thermodesulfobacteriota bacterium]|nr:MAG: hypothetical protein BMS9Abin23_0555 [Thermodesulfobacteriota bacterium]